MSDIVMLAAALGAVCAALALVLGRLGARRRKDALEAAARAGSDVLRRAAQADAAAARRDAEIAAREEALALRAEAEAAFQASEGQLAAGESRWAARDAELTSGADGLARRRAGLAEGQERLRAREEEGRTWRDAKAAAERDARAALERAAGQAADAVRAGIIEAEIEDARGTAAQLLRSVEHVAADGDQARDAQRVMGIAVGRFSGHYLTERLLSNIPLGPPPVADPIIGPDEAHLRAIEAVANVKLLLAETRDAVRLEGLDGVGREVARRCLQWLARNPKASDASKAFRDIAARLQQEIAELGRRAFATLEIPRAHPDIVRLVGALNWRTSFTQNQWKHAVEAAFLCGMMADEMGLDLKTARRAALMHDIGKALTHELDGSHAVIGADYARRLGEREEVANAIGAHHTDEPFNSPYAYLVAAADAMSGARPGARRQMEENFVARIADLERITRAFRGVAEAYAVQGGREVRVYVNEGKVDDAGAVEMSSAIARRISEEMTFPGQIKVTVIRELVAEDMAG